MVPSGPLVRTFLQDTAKTLAPLLDIIGEGVLVVDPAGTPVLWNAAAPGCLAARSTSRVRSGGEARSWSTYRWAKRGARSDEPVHLAD
jgi:hypothetical protein